MTALTDRFRALHESGTFLIPNPWDLGSARYLEWRGFDALATTSSGLAATLGRQDQTVSRDELVAHVAALTAELSIPLNVDAERCFGHDPAGVAETIRLLAEAGAAGASIEDYDPATGRIDDLDTAVERVAAAAEAAAASGLVLTARTENQLYGHDDIEVAIERLIAFREAGAEVLYAPGLVDRGRIARVVESVGAPINVLARPNGPPVEELTALGVRRISTGGSLAWAALGGLKMAVDEWLDTGTMTFADVSLAASDRAAAFGRDETR